MEIRESGYKYRYLRHVSWRKHKPYDYKNEGLLKQCLPEVIINATNPVTRYVIRFVERCLVFLMKYVDELRYFKDWNRKPF